VSPAALLAALMAAGEPVPAAQAGCADCHAKPAAGWQASGHARAWSSPLFQAGLAVERRRFCVDCHAPDGAKTTAAGWRGIGCASCHTSSNPHDRREVAALRAADACRRCHEFATPEWIAGEMRTTALPMQSTFSEWQAYQRAGGAGTCQSCHMPGGDHVMHGAHDVNLLRRALAVSARAAGDSIAFTLRSVGVGHRYPTGDLFRHLTVEIAESGGDFRTVHRIGRLFDTALDAATLLAHKVETANTTLAPGETRTVIAAARGPLIWRVRYHYGSERDELLARLSYDQLVVTLFEGAVSAEADVALPAGRRR
jgi:hypothetical protein